MTRPLLSRDEQERVADLEARELDGILARDEAEELDELRSRITPTPSAEVDRVLAELREGLALHPVAEELPPVDEWVIGLWYLEARSIIASPPESGTVRLGADGRWYDEMDDWVGDLAPTHWITIPKLESA